MKRWWWLPVGACSLIGFWTILDRVGTHTEAAATSVPAARRAAARAKLEAPEKEFDFGVLDVGQTGEHVFEIRNAGDAPLELKQGPSSCKCTLSDLQQGTLAPGETGRVRLAWKTPDFTERFRHGATIYSNDPANPEIQLVVSGKVRTHLGFTPPQLIFTDVRRDEDAQGKLIVYSQAWDSFEIASATVDDPHFSVAVRPAEGLDELEARSGYELTVTLNPGLPRGRFAARLSLEARGSVKGEAKVAKWDVPIQGNVMGDLSLQGKDLEGNWLTLGKLLPGEGAVRRLSLFARGEHRELDLRPISVEPQCLKVEVSPGTLKSDKVSQYFVRIELPASSPPIDCLGPKKAGRIKLSTGHPDQPEVVIRVDFAVVPSTMGQPTWPPARAAR